MKKKFSIGIALILIGALMATVSVLSGCADGNSGKNVLDGVVYELSEDGKSYVVADIEGFTAAEFAIPATYKNLPVSEIAEKAFSGCKTVEKLIVPESITVIGAAAFKGCKSLKEITLPFVGESANATGEESLLGWIFGNKAYSNSYKIYQTTDKDEFKAYIPNDLTKVTVTGEAPIAYGAFSFCENLEQAAVLKATEIGDNAFADCDALSTVYIGTAQVASAITEGSSCGGICLNASIIYIADGVTNVGGYITDSLDLQDEKYDVFGMKFSRYSAYEQGGLYFRKQNGTYQVIGLSPSFSSDTLEIPSKVKNTDVTSIRASAFAGADKIKKVYLPATLTEIGDDAFKGCSSLKDIYVASEKIARETADNASFGSVFYYANNIFVAAGITNVTDYFTQIFLEYEKNAETVGGTTYNKYSGTETTTRFEAEYGVFTGINNEGGTAFVRGNPVCSNGQYVGNMNVPGNTMKFVITSSHTVRAKINVCVASLQQPNGNIDAALSSMYNLTVNGITPQGYESVIIRPSDWAKSPGGSYTDFVIVPFEIDLIAGENIVLFTAGGTTNNVDYIELVCMSRLSWTPTQNEFKQND